MERPWHAYSWEPVDVESPTELAEDGQLWRNGAVQQIIEQSTRQGEQDRAQVPNAGGR